MGQVVSAVSGTNLVLNQGSSADNPPRVTSLRHRTPRDHQHQDLISSERLSRGRQPFVSNICSEKEVDAKAWRSSDTALGGVAEKVCIFSDSPASVTETFVVAFRGGCGGGRNVTAPSVPSAINFKSFAFFF